MDKPNILLDVDGVCLNWTAGLEKYIQAHLPHISTAEQFDEHAFDLASRYGIDSDQANQLVWDFHHHESFADLQPLPGAVQAVDVLSQLGNVVAITACGKAKKIVQSRIHNLQEYFGDCFVNVHCTDTFDEKHQYLAYYAPGFWVEDHLKNAVAGVEYGHTSFLVSTLYNQRRDHEAVQRVKDLLEASEIIRERLHTKCRQ